MNFKDAMQYVVTKNEEGDEDVCMIGVTHQPNSMDGEYQIVTLSYEYDGFDALNDFDSDIWLLEAMEDDCDFDNERERGEIFGADHDEDFDDDEEFACFKAEINGGNILSSEGSEDYFNESTVDDLIASLPEYAATLNYQPYSVQPQNMELAAEHALSLLFPDLPSIHDHENDFGLVKFKAAAIKLITELNSSVTE